jgi:hypothetical protein
MLQKFVLAFAILAIGFAFAGTVPSVHVYTVTLVQAAVVNGTTLQPGDYKLTVDAAKITLTKGKVSVQSPAKIELNEKKFSETALRYVGNNLAEIRLEGTKNRIVLNQ